MQLSLNYNIDRGPRGFRPKAVLMIPRDGLGGFEPYPICSDEEYSTPEDANDAAWQLAVALRDRDYTTFDLVDETRFSAGHEH
jgi:hypothetical protein